MPPIPPAFRNHPLFSGRVGILSGENPMFPASVSVGHHNLIDELNTLGIKHEQAQGHYGAPERSVILHNPSRQQVVNLGKKYGQESVIYGENGKHQLIYTNGPKAGFHHKGTGQVDFWPESSPPEDLYTKVPGRGAVRIGFNWERTSKSESPAHRHMVRVPGLGYISIHFDRNQLHPEETLKSEHDSNLNPINGSHTVADKKHEINEVRQVLAKTIRDRIEEYSQEMMELRARELRKTATCPMCGESDNPESCQCLRLQKAELAKVTPPGREEQVKELKGKVKNPWAVAWASYNKGKKAKKTEKALSIEPPVQSPAMGLGPEVQPVLKAEMCKQCKAEHVPGQHLTVRPGRSENPPESKKSEDFINLKSPNIPGKRLKNKGQAGVTPDDKAPVDMSDKDTGSGGQIKAGKMAKAAPAMGAPPPGRNPAGPTPVPKAGSPKVGGAPKAPPVMKGELEKAAIPPLAPGAKPIRLPGHQITPGAAVMPEHGVPEKLLGIKPKADPLAPLAQPVKLLEPAPKPGIFGKLKGALGKEKK